MRDYGVNTWATDGRGALASIPPYLETNLHMRSAELFGRPLPAVMVAFSVFLACGPAFGDETLEPIIDRWVSSCQEIRSYDVVLTVSNANVDEDTGDRSVYSTSTIRQRYQDGMWRVDRFDSERFGKHASKSTTPPDALDAFAWDLKSIRTCNSGSNIAVIMNRRRFKESMLPGPLYHQGFFSSNSGESYAENIRKRGNASVVRKAGGRYTIVAPPAPRKLVSWVTETLEVDLCPEYGFMPSEIRIIRGSEPLIVIACEQKRWRENLWAPSRIIKKTYSGQGEGKPYYHKASETVVDVSEAAAHFNVKIDPAVFSMEIPGGTIVWDDIEKRNHIAKAGNGRDYEAYNAYIKEKVLPLGSRSLSITAKAMVAMNVAVVGVLVFLGLKRWWRKRRKN